MCAVSTNALAAMVNASNNIPNNGVATGLTLSAGQTFSVTAAVTDLWSAGALPRWSNANGLTGDRYATGSDESGQAAGTTIGINFGLYADPAGSGFSAPFGALVGRIGPSSPGNNYFFIGTNYLGQAAVAGELFLFYWDSIYSDNSNSISASVSAVPLPAAAWLLLSGFVGLVAVGRRGSTRSVLA